MSLFSLSTQQCLWLSFLIVVLFLISKSGLMVNFLNEFFSELQKNYSDYSELCNQKETIIKNLRHYNWAQKISETKQRLDKELKKNQEDLDHQLICFYEQIQKKQEALSAAKKKEKMKEELFLLLKKRFIQ